MDGGLIEKNKLMKQGRLKKLQKSQEIQNGSLWECESTSAVNKYSKNAFVQE